MTPDDREFGRLEGKVEAVGEQISDLRASNSREHAAVVARFDRLEASLRESLVGKADRAVVDQHTTRIDSLESTRDKGAGISGFLKGAVGFILAAAGFFVGQGKHP